MPGSARAREESSRLRDDALACLEEGLRAVAPEPLVRDALTRRPEAPRAPTRLLAVGKAAAGMARGASRALGSALREGLVVVPSEAEAEVPAPFRALAAGHPLPDAGSLAAGAAAHALASDLGPGERLLCLLSGGASSLMSLPSEGLSLAEIARTTELLAGAGATISELNAVRKHLDRLKGGGLARAAAPAEVLGLVLSDVVGNRLEVIASGPLSPDPYTYAQALDVVARHGLGLRIPARVWEHLERGSAGELAETPGPGDPCFHGVRIEIVGDNRLAAEAALSEARRRGYAARLLTTRLQGEASEVGRLVAERALEAARPRSSAPICLVAAGETTVTVRGRGRGGRNQELALGAARKLAGRSGILLASIGTDGIDGPTDAAGAFVSGDTLSRARALGLDPEAALAENDTYPFFDALGDLVRTGPTGTNVMDLQIVLIRPG